MAKNMTGIETRPTAEGRRAIREGRYADAASLPARMKQHRVSRKVNGQRVQTKFHPTAKAAEEEFSELVEKVERGTKVDRATTRMTVEQYAARWLEKREALAKTKALSEDTVANNRVQITAYILPGLAYRPLTMLTGDEIVKWRASLTAQRTGKPLAESSRIKATATLSTMLSDAVDDGLLDRSPMQKRSGRAAVPRAKEQEGENLYLEPRQLQRLADAIDPQYRLLIMVAGLCGPRIGELTSLAGGSVTEDGDLLIRASMNRRGKIGNTKTARSRRVRVPAFLAQDVIALAHTRAQTERLFQTPSGAPVNRTNFRTRTFACARDAAATAVSELQKALGVIGARPGVFCPRTASTLELELPGSVEVGPREWTRLGVSGAVARTTLAPGDRDFSTDFTFHDLRHTAASIAIASGANIKAVQEMLGHKKITTTLDLYAGLFEADRVATAAGIEETYLERLAPRAA